MLDDIMSYKKNFSFSIIHLCEKKYM